MIDAQSALIYLMVIVSASEDEMTDNELRAMGEIVNQLPVFKDFDADELPRAATDCARLLADEDGLEQAFVLIADAVPARLRETAYALACEVAAADGSASQEELRILEIVRHRLDVDRLAAAAIERGARARHAEP